MIQGREVLSQPLPPVGGVVGEYFSPNPVEGETGNFFKSTQAERRGFRGEGIMSHSGWRGGGGGVFSAS